MKKIFLALPMVLAAGLASAQATGAAAAFQAEVAAQSTNLATYGAGLVTVGAIGVGFLIAVKYIKKIRGAA